MDTTTGTSHANKDAALSRKHGRIRPTRIFLAEPREIDEDTVAGLVEALECDGCFVHPIVVRAEGAARYRLIAGYQRLEAHKRHFGEQKHIEATVHHPDTPDARITALELEEDLLRKDLSAAERQAKTLELTAARKKLNGGKLTTELPVSGSDATSGGRGRKAATAKMADMLGLSKTAMQNRIDAASAAIGEKIDLDRDTPEELERKAEKRRHSEPKVERPKSRKPAPGGVIEDPTRSAEPQASETESQIEQVEKLFNALDLAAKRWFIYHACLDVDFDPLLMAPPATFGLADEDPEVAVDLPAEDTPATDDAPMDPQAEPPASFGLADEGPELAVDQPAEAAPATDDAAVVSEPEQQDDAADPGGEDPQDADDEPPTAFGLTDEDSEVTPATDEAAVAQAKQGDDGADLDAEDVQDAGDDVPEAADPEIGVTKCPQCKGPFTSSDPAAPETINGRRYHLKKCLGWAKEMAIAAE